MEVRGCATLSVVSEGLTKVKEGRGYTHEDLHETRGYRRTSCI